jgi:glycine betaine/choline ABC-type transport system substrate-binding protein
VRSNEFTEIESPGREVVAQLLESQNVEVERRFDLGGGNLGLHTALLGGPRSIFYPEYTGSAFTAIPFIIQPSTDPQSRL